MFLMQRSNRGRNALRTHVKDRRPFIVSVSDASECSIACDQSAGYHFSGFRIHSSLAVSRRNDVVRTETNSKWLDRGVLSRRYRRGDRALDGSSELRRLCHDCAQPIGRRIACRFGNHEAFDSAGDRPYPSRSGTTSPLHRPIVLVRTAGIAATTHSFVFIAMQIHLRRDGHSSAA